MAKKKKTIESFEPEFEIHDSIKSEAINGEENETEKEVKKENGDYASHPKFNKFNLEEKGA